MPKTFGASIVRDVELKAAEKNVKKIVDDAFVDQPKKWYEYIVFSLPYLIIAWASVIFVIGLLFIFIRAYLWKKRILKAMPLKQGEIYQRLFQDNYSNIKVSDLSNSTISRKLLYKYRGGGVPANAWIVSVTPSPIFTIDKSEMVINSVTWKYKSGKETYTVLKTYTQVTPTAKRFDDMKFSMARRGLLSFNHGKDMDNDRFNKEYSFKHNNPMKFRMLFTVATQEKYVAIGKRRIGKTLKIDKEPNMLFMSHSRIGTPFVANTGHVTLDDNKFKAMIADDLKKDVKVVLEIITTITSLNGIIEK